MYMMDLIFTFPIYSLYMKICSGQQIKTSVLGMLMRNYMSEGGRSWKSNQSDEHAYSDPLISPRSLWLGLDNFLWISKFNGGTAGARSNCHVGPSPTSRPFNPRVSSAFLTCQCHPCCAGPILDGSTAPRMLRWGVRRTPADAEDAIARRGACVCD